MLNSKYWNNNHCFSIKNRSFVKTILAKGSYSFWLMCTPYSYIRIYFTTLKILYLLILHLFQAYIKWNKHFAPIYCLDQIWRSPWWYRNDHVIKVSQPNIICTFDDSFNTFVGIKNMFWIHTNEQILSDHIACSFVQSIYMFTATRL